MQDAFLLSTSRAQALIAFASAGQESCGPNEVWTECTGCEMKCGDPENTPCPLMCRRPSCECSPGRGMRRTNDGKCIPASQCPQHRAKREEHSCKENEQWTPCRGCEGTCAQRFVPCTRNCRPPGCECLARAGFVRDAQGKCIKFDDCPK
uniref:TIL domain-containing protein n=1 Tax=Ascaris lumbricoides TaxID=6252 RepID=A0A0M3HN15_ASCLU